MIINSQGFGHFTDGQNNQDFGIETPRMVLILDGCSAGRYSEVGTRLFSQLFSRKEEFDSLEKFEDNVKSVFDDIIEMLGQKYYPKKEDLQDLFVMENLLFTIIACFETEDKYIVKLFGDGYIVTKNNRGKISYMKYSYGDCPPYFAYKYTDVEPFKDYEFKTFVFEKKIFPRIAIATDGIMPIAKGCVKGFDNLIFDKNEIIIRRQLRNEIKSFDDDITIATLGGKQ